MPAYIRACTICFNQFRTGRVNTMYCSRKCRNKARNMPTKVLQALINKTAATTIVIETVPKVVRDYIRNNPNMTELSGITNLDKTDIEEITMQAMKIKRDRELKRLAIEFGDKVIEDNDGMIDPEMVNLKLGDDGDVNNIKEEGD